MGVEDQVERAIDRATAAVEKLLAAHMRTVEAELRAIRNDLRPIDTLRGDVEQLRIDMMAVQAVESAHGHQLAALEAARHEREALERQHVEHDADQQREDTRHWRNRLWALGAAFVGGGIAELVHLLAHLAA